MGARTGTEFLAGLARSRPEIWLGNEKVTDVLGHPALAGAARMVARIFDVQHEAAGDCLVPDPETGEPINASHMIPCSRADLEQRHRCIQRCADVTVGLMGRSPDYMNVTFAGFAARPDEWGMNGNEEGAANLIAYQKLLRRRDLSLTHTIIHPTIDKSRGDFPGNDVALHKVADTAHGIVVRGARILATLAPFADELAVYPAFPLPDGADAHALAFCIPIDAPGLKFVCRDSCATPRNLFDHPISSRFDEQDAFVIFDDVEIPRDRLFIAGNRPVYNQVMLTSWSPNIMQQTMIRAQTKLEFAWGLATRMTEAIGDSSPASTQMLGELWSYAEFARAAVRAAEADAFEWVPGVWFPRAEPLSALRAALPTWFPRVSEIMTLLGSHNLLAAPTASQLADPALAPFVDRYLRGANGVTATDRARIFRLAWDFVGSALAARGVLYERFYLASGARNYQMNHKLAPKERAFALVDRFLKEDLDGTDAPAASAAAPAAARAAAGTRMQAQQR